MATITMDTPTGRQSITSYVWHQAMEQKISCFLHGLLAIIAFLVTSVPADMLAASLLRHDSVGPRLLGSLISAVGTIFGMGVMESLLTACGIQLAEGSAPDVGTSCQLVIARSGAIARFVGLRALVCGALGGLLVIPLVGLVGLAFLIMFVIKTSSTIALILSSDMTASEARARSVALCKGRGFTVFLTLMVAHVRLSIPSSLVLVLSVAAVTLGHPFVGVPLAIVAVGWIPMMLTMYFVVEVALTYCLATQPA
jgi:hypothetical protein